MFKYFTGSAREKLALNTFFNLTSTVDSLVARVSQRGAHGNLTPSQFGALQALYYLGTMCHNELADKILKSSGNLTLVIDNLEKNGLVKRVRDTQDRRMVKVHLTEEGQRLIEELLPAYAENVFQELEALTPEEQEILVKICRKLNRSEDVKTA